MGAQSGFRHDQAFAARDGGPKVDSPSPVDLLLRVATVVGEIEALKRERHKQELLSSRIAFASAYFRKRRRGERPTRP